MAALEVGDVALNPAGVIEEPLGMETLGERVATGHLEILLNAPIAVYIAWELVGLGRE